MSLWKILDKSNAILLLSPCAMYIRFQIVNFVYFTFNEHGTFFGICDVTHFAQ